MKIIVRSILLFVLFPLHSMAADAHPFGIGVNMDLPYTLMVDGSGNGNRQNLNVGVEARRWFLSTANYSVRFFFDGEKQTGSVRQIGISPGIAHHWMPLENWRPYIRLEVPVILKGAINLTGSSGSEDLGFAPGVGFVWKLGDAIGVNRMEFRYDFGFQYLVGIGDAVSVLALDLFRVGVDYRF